jgi:predicted DNA-binding protein with PD1-like motif
MRSKLLNADPPITYAVVLDTGDEVIGELGKFVREQEVEAASVTAIGAFSRAVLGYTAVGQLANNNRPDPTRQPLSFDSGVYS